MNTYLHKSSELAVEFWASGKSASCPVIDMHAHMGSHYGIFFPAAEPEEMARQMECSGVKLVCFSHHSALFSPETANSLSVEAVRRFPDKFRAYLAINPNYPEQGSRELKLLDRHPEFFAGLKFLASYHRQKLDSTGYREALTLANERGLPVLLHTWGGCEFCGTEQVRLVAQKYPRVKFILGHSLFGKWDEAVRVTKDFPNTYLELTALVGMRGVVEMLSRGAGSDRLLYGTDLPWFDEHHYIGNILCADLSDADRHNILHRNAERLLESSGIRMP